MVPGCDARAGAASPPVPAEPQAACRGEPRQFNPSADQTGNEFKAKVLAAFEATTQRQKAISIKLPEALLERTRAEAKRRGVPYQPLIKIVREESLDRLGAA